MTRGKKSSSKKPPTRKRARKRADAMTELLDAAVRETAADFSCSIDICRHYAEQLEQEITDREPVLPLTQLAVDVWHAHRAELPELVATLEALFAERLRHDEAIVELSNQFIALGKDERRHADLSPVEPIEEMVRRILIESATRAALVETDDGPPTRH